ncbi:MAG: hypothetical protein ACN6NW_06950 [Acinetobacter amyesii]|uniref:hypothetical protein n=1 Tax=Acinetobacter amyesii TaxID=2942470 RepID=UPI003D091875
MKFSILDYKVLQFAFRAEEQIVRFFNKPKKSELLPVKVKMVIPDEEEISGKELLLIFKIDAKDFLDDLDDGFFQLHFVVRFGTDDIISEGFGKTNWLEESGLPEKGFPLVVSWLNNFFVNSGYNTYFPNGYNFEKM